MSTVDGARELAAQFSTRESSLDVLVHNAGAVWSENFDSFPEAGWDKVLNVNLKAPFFLTQILLPVLAESGKQRCAKVINITSIDGFSVNPLETYSYSASKAGLIHLTRRMALTLIKDNIVASCIAPGAFASDMNTEARDHADELARRIPAVGETLVVDGGWSHARG